MYTSSPRKPKNFYKQTNNQPPEFMKQRITDSLYRIYHHLPVVRKLELEAVFILFIITIGAIAFHRVEHWRFLDAIYFVTTTLATVGYGDIVPKTDTGKMITIVYELIGIPIFLYTASLLVERSIQEHIDGKTIKKQKKELERNPSL